MPTEAPFQTVVKGAVDQLTRNLYDLGNTVATAIEKSSSLATMQIVSVLNNGLLPVFSQIKTTLAGSINVNALYADGESDIYKGFSGTITGTGKLTVWTPATNTRFLLKGYAITGVVSTDAIAAASGPLLYLCDAGNSDAVVAPISAFGKASAAETTIIGGAAAGIPYVVNLGSGRLGSATGSSGPLKIRADVDIVGGDIKLVGVVWGREIPNV